jgi:hypothetical protein
VVGDAVGAGNAGGAGGAAGGVGGSHTSGRNSKLRSPSQLQSVAQLLLYPAALCAPSLK